MKSSEKIIFFLLPLSALFSELTFIPNRILIFLSMLWMVFRDKRILNYVLKRKWLIPLAITYLTFILFSNKYLSNEAVLFLTIPIYMILYGSSNLGEFLLKKYFILATFTYAALVVVSKTIQIASIGFSNFFEEENWWNELLYKSLIAPLQGHPTYIAMFILAGVILILHNYGHSKKYFSKAQGLIILLTLLGILLLLVVKISLLTLGLIAVMFVISLFQRNSNKKASIGLMMLTISVITVFNIPGVKHRILNDVNFFKSSETSINDAPNRIRERAALWESSAEFIIENPISGSSFQGKSSKESIYPLAKKLYPQLEYAKNSHNNFLEFGVRYGLPGAMTFLFFLFIYVKTGIKTASFEIVGIAVILCLFSLTESFIFREQGISFVAIFTALFRKQVYGKDF